jgi:CRISPR-associated protein Cas5d
MKKSKPFRFRITGSIACFTRPEMKVERVSYEVITPSAARGAIEAVLWKPAIVYQIHRIWVQAPIRWTSFRRNEVNSVASVLSAKNGGLVADEDRAQRNTVALRDVDYVVEASFSMTDRAGPGDNLVKFEEMLARRLEKGQCFQTPYLGCREFAGDLQPFDGEPLPIDPGVERPLGLMFFDFQYGGAKTRPLFFDARLHGGVVVVPPWKTVLAENGLSTNIGGEA